jgi:hypothetical protein
LRPSLLNYNIYISRQIKGPTDLYCTTKPSDLIHYYPSSTYTRRRAKASLSRTSKTILTNWLKQYSNFYRQKRPRILDTSWQPLAHLTIHIFTHIYTRFLRKPKAPCMNIAFSLFYIIVCTTLACRHITCRHETTDTHVFFMGAQFTRTTSIFYINFYTKFYIINTNFTSTSITKTAKPMYIRRQAKGLYLPIYTINETTDTHISFMGAQFTRTSSIFYINFYINFYIINTNFTCHDKHFFTSIFTS